MGREEEGSQVGRTRSPDALTPRERSGALHRRLRAVGLVLLTAAKATTLVAATDAVLRPDHPKYRGKHMRVRAVGYVGGLALVPGTWVAYGRRGRYPVAADLAMSAPLLIDAAGNSLGIYDEARLDDVVHGVNAAVLSALFGALVSPHLGSRAAATLVTAVVGIVGEVAWDAMEYGAERLGAHGLGLSPSDTIADVAIASMGVAVGATITWLRWRPSAGAPFVGRRLRI